MKALLIVPSEKSIQTVEIGSQQDIIDLIGFDTVIADDIADNGDRLYFDEECFLRGTAGRFQIDRLIPVSGNGVVTGSGSDDSLADIQTDSEELKSRIVFLQ